MGMLLTPDMGNRNVSQIRIDNNQFTYSKQYFPCISCRSTAKQYEKRACPNIKQVENLSLQTT
jgi:anaerobic ribonucleoside-triphosphate reductase